MVSLEDIYQRASSLGKQKFPNASWQKHHAFANSVCYLVLGSSKLGPGPSVREHAVTYAVMISLKARKGEFFNPDKRKSRIWYPPEGAKLFGSYSFEEAVKIAEPVVYGRLTELHFDCWLDEFCYDDDPEDLLVFTQDSKVPNKAN